MSLISRGCPFVLTALAAACPAAFAQSSEAPASPAVAASAPAAATLPEVKVTAASTSDPTSEGSRSFAARSASVVKGGAELRDIPQPVTVVTRQLLEDRLLLDLTDVLQGTAGVQVDYTDSERVTYFSRGYQIDALQLDGLTLNQGGSHFIQPDTATLDRVEVLRGASGMVRGSGNPSATVNLVRKRPTSEYRTSGAVSLGSWERKRLELDVSGAMNTAGTLRGRVVGVYDDKEFFQKTKQEEKQTLYGVLEADLSPRTLWTGSLQYSVIEATGAWGNLPRAADGSALDLSRDTYLGADWNRWDRFNVQAFTSIEHQFDNAWTVKASAAQTRLRLKDNGFRQSYFDRLSTPASPNPDPTNPYVMRVASAAYTGAQSDQSALNVNADGPFTLFSRRHKLVVGAEVVRVKSLESWGIGSQAPVWVDIRTWDPAASYPDPNLRITTGGSLPTVTRQEAVYATGSFSVMDPLTVNLGARLSWWDTYSPTTAYAIDRQLTPYAGAVYDLSDTMSAYASYTEIFNPQNARNAAGDILDPVTGEDYEVGVKGEFLDGRVTAHVGTFRINNVGAALEDASSPNPCTPYYPTGYCRVAGGKSRSKGYELEVAGEVARGWQVSGGYTQTRTEYVRGTAAQVGQPIRQIDPKHQLKLFSSYQLGGALDGITVGAGVQAFSGITATSGTAAARQPGFAVYNAMLGYRFNQHVQLQLNANNVFDKVYYKKIAATGISNYYGDPRNFMLTLRGTL